MSTTSERVRIRTDGRVGRIRLDRPEALHALDLGMCEAMIAALKAWREDPAVEGVLIDHASGRGFCAGGDIRTLAGSSAESVERFFLTEYRLNALIHTFPKPTLVVMDGVTMGGGLGLAWPCRYRVATERSLLAMPEAAIGLFPDVGMGWRLARLPGRTGLWMALTGARLGPADALLTGLATDFAASDAVEPIKSAFIAEPAAIDLLLTECEQDPGEAGLGRVRDPIDRLFDRPSVEAILSALDEDGSDWAREQARAMRSGSPTTLKVAFRQIRQAAALEHLEEEMVVEHRLAVRIGASAEFREGVRAALIERDNRPRWRPERLEEVSDDRLDALFAPLGAGRDWTPSA